MHCPHCASDIQTELTAEINIHFSGLRNIDNPGLLVFPKLLVCLECGFSSFTIPENGLALLAMCFRKSDASNPRRAVDVELRRTTAA